MIEVLSSRMCGLYSAYIYPSSAYSVCISLNYGPYEKVGSTSLKRQG